MALSLSAAQVQVARIFGGQNDSDELVVAGDAIAYAIRDWNAFERPWSFKYKEDVTIDLAKGDPDYDLPTDFNKVHSVSLVGDGKPTLKYMDQREFDREIRNQTRQGTSTHYIILPGATVEQIRLWPVPSAAVTDGLTLRYYSSIPETASPLDFPDKYLNIVIQLARYYYLMEKDATDPRVARFERDGRRGMARLWEEDHKQPDKDVRLISQMESGSAYNALTVHDPLQFL